MEYKIVGKNINVTEGLRTAVEEKLGKLEKFFKKGTKVQVTMSVEKDTHKIEVTIPVKGSIIRAEQESNDMYVSIDLVEEIIERQLKKYKNKLIDRSHEGGHFQPEYIDFEQKEDDSIRIVRNKKFDLKPMDPEEACLQMELIGHDFFVFRNSDTDELNVVYKRSANTYGLIEPEY